ncbi:hypothetical protein [Methanosphaera sp.]
MNSVKILLEKIEEADAICIGGAAGLSSADGYDFYYNNDDLFNEVFGSFIEKYGIQNVFDGFYYPYTLGEEHWGFLATEGHFILHAQANKVYTNLSKLVGDKEVFAVTTNQDGLFSRILPDEKISTIQGDWRYLQCGLACHDKLYSSHEVIDKLYENVDDNCCIPSDMIPKCPKCGCEMEPWIRSFSFLQGTKYKEEYNKWETFIEENKNKKILFLELGVGRMTPMFIQEPFWDYTEKLPRAYYININPNDAKMPETIKNKGMLISKDIAQVLDEAIRLKEDI